MNDREPAPGDTTSSRNPAPAPLAADVGIVAATSIEMGYLLDRLSRVRKYAGPKLTIIEGEYAGKVIALVVGGMGRAAAKSATEVMLLGHRPRWIVSAGFAGALDPALKRNDVLLPNEIVDLAGQQFIVDVKVPPESSASTSLFKTGRLLTADAVICRAAEKAELRARYQADLVDMETAAVSAVCSERGVRFLPVRIVSDDAHVDLPQEILTVMSSSGSYRIGAALRSIWNRPSTLKDFWKLHGQALESSDRLAAVTLAAIESLPI